MHKLFLLTFIFVAPSLAMSQELPSFDEGSPICFKFSQGATDPKGARTACLANESSIRSALQLAWQRVPQNLRTRCQQLGIENGSYSSIYHCIQLGISLGLAGNNVTGPSRPNQIAPQANIQPNTPPLFQRPAGPGRDGFFDAPPLAPAR